ncbi:prephenate dehydrogenase [Curtobacterium sp. MCSS17_015]|uniref:prephenate dehydrogenase n=1 Tax=Curtobacterium sp. MCSS17_015 TaxID=2175666 RepID=UPI000DA92892|nr:prephenate dehydrogenase [Curtobacterium sp. MCSS17_015]WIB27512.1 prephenate dehydrogenase [Curtobacterium sp. MCSS17_015]
MTDASTNTPDAPVSDDRSPSETDRRLRGPVRIVGTGLLGASIGLALRDKGVDVVLDDVSPAALALAVDYGAGRRPSPGDAPELIVVAVPPDVTAAVVERELAAFPDAVVTDVASVKSGPLERLRAVGADVSRYIGSHPMAGRERSGPTAARADLFIGRPWVIAGHDDITYHRAAAVEDLALDLGATVVPMDPESHDQAVAVVSHVPQLVSTLMASRLRDAPGEALGLAGGGVRDVTRIAASDPGLWVQIIGANAAHIRPVLTDLRDELDRVIGALADPTAPGSPRSLAETIASGNRGVERLPGKHGSTTRFARVVVLIDDRPGQFAALLTTIGELGINLEDLHLEHSPRAQIGIVEVSVVPEHEQRLVEELEGRGWRIAAAWA